MADVTPEPQTDITDAIGDEIDKAKDYISPEWESIELGCAIAAIVLGLVVCFFGRKTVKLCFFLLGFSFGAALSGMIAWKASEQHLLATAITAGIVGVASGVVATCSVTVGKVLLGLGLGGLTAVLVVELGVANSIGNNAGVWVLTGTLSLVGVFFAYKAFKFVLILVTSFGGAFAAALGVSFFVGGHLSIQRIMEDPSSVVCDNRDCILLLSGWFVVGLSGCVFQIQSRRKEKKQKAEQDCDVSSRRASTRQSKSQSRIWFLKGSTNSNDPSHLSTELDNLHFGSAKSSV